ncbi:MAG TPA: STAS domain-containing protein [Terracidiphilus sp.]|jgi:anti-sigma B factor antagonist|nr:STAS domain-containing protein [Terracidiphilus sp.]
MHEVPLERMETTHRARPVAVKQMPTALDSEQERKFLHEMETCLDAWRPSIVLDCSEAQQIDYTLLHLLLCCLEEAMKRNGDVRLAAVQPEAREILKRWRLDRLFRIFETTAEAINSFQRPSLSAIYANCGYPEPAEDAA